MAENNAFGNVITDREKQEMYESMVIYTMLVKAASSEANQNGDKSGIETYRQLVGKILHNISGMPPDQIRSDPATGL